MKLPRLLSETPPSRSNKKAESETVANSMDIMLMKRMNYIRNSLDTHDSLDQTC